MLFDNRPGRDPKLDSEKVGKRFNGAAKDCSGCPDPGDRDFFPIQDECGIAPFTIFRHRGITDEDFSV
jgi:hypothetical protein